MYLKITFIVLFIALTAKTQTLYINPLIGDDTKPGTLEEPLKTLTKAAKLINNSDTQGTSTLILAPGLYHIEQTVLFKSNHRYSKSQRLTIQAHILPDDTAWTHQDMPIIISTEIPKKWKLSGSPQELTAIQIETSHVTIKGIKFLGSPVPTIWHYPIARYGKTLTDLHITQCAFVMDRAGVTSNVGILSNGHATVVDHCIFYRCRNPVVFWRAEGGKSIGNAMHHCIIHDAYTSAIWVCDTETDLLFHHNIIDGAEYVWMRDAGASRNYSLSNCIITDFKTYSGQSGDGFKLSLTGPEIIYKEVQVIKSGNIELVNDHGIDAPLPRNYLHVKPGTKGSKLGAGLFLKAENRK
ncbi:right-handed parallel beta-helix repeat-containing protein [bacterium]|nr:right-handed parallel beta-helix repeat-containing protein [bacterium]